jgi:hypothetical protein
MANVAAQREPGLLAIRWSRLLAVVFLCSGFFVCFIRKKNSQEGQ